MDDCAISYTYEQGSRNMLTCLLQAN